MENLDLMIILAQIINFLIIFYIFKKLLWDKLSFVIKQRRDLAKKLEWAEKEYRITLEKAYSEKNKILKDARKEANKLFRDMENISKSREQEILERAEKRAKMIVEWWNRQLEKDKLEMIAWVKSYILDLTLKLNEKLLGDSKVDKNYIKKELEKIA